MEPWSCTGEFKESYSRRFLRALKRLRRNSNCSGNEIKLAADVSLAVTAQSTRRGWSHSALETLCRREEDKQILRTILGPRRYNKVMSRRAKMLSFLAGLRWRRRICRRRYYVSARRTFHRRSADEVVWKSRQLQRLVPGGNSMDISCLLRETADYIFALKSQVEAMQSLLSLACSPRQQQQQQEEAGNAGLSCSEN